MGGRKSKQAGSSYEYRVKEWFEKRSGWKSKRIALSGAVEEIGRHDVHAWKDDIYLTIEAKKRTRVKDPKKRSQIEIKKEWINQILFDKDEILVFAMDRTPHYCLIPTTRFFKILNRSFEIEYNKDNTFRGTSQFLFKREYIDDTLDARFHLQWGPKQEKYTTLLLEEFVTLRETVDLQNDLTFEERIRRLNDLSKAIDFEKLYLEELDYKQKRMLYGKLEELESGRLINPAVHADQQFWLGEDAFVLVCPHCKEKVTKKDLTEARKKKDEGFIDWDR